MRKSENGFAALMFSSRCCREIRGICPDIDGISRSGDGNTAADAVETLRNRRLLLQHSEVRPRHLKAGFAPNLGYNDNQPISQNRPVIHGVVGLNEEEQSKKCIILCLS